MITQGIAASRFETMSLVFQTNRVPPVTPDFWLVKLLAVTVGETAADYLAVNMGIGLTTTSIIMTLVLCLALTIQFAQKRYVPAPYWITVVLISIVGTLVTDNLTDNFGVALLSSTVFFSAGLLAIFAVWYFVEGTLSIHTVFTARREAFYWLAIMFTFSLGTAVGDLLAESMDLGYLATGSIFAASIALIASAYYVLGMNGILAFWMAYIFTRPLGASLGDLLSQPTEYGGLGFGTIATSLLFLICIAAVIFYMTLTYKRDGRARKVARRA
ncbi:putative membrane-anchored protein [Rhodoligotrophos appendicifer]|uniref:COG4705 family protein n=1 Tax=Rhodoligotrophos appendicifer TaxID=987056 RepID=UPI001FE7602E|nr:hypothetical protein [Rhodoligotrophos appendicifer]